MAGLVLVHFCTGTGPIGAAAFSVKASGLLSSVKPITSSPGSGYRAGNRPSRGRFLVAARGIRDPRFAETVILLIEYGPRGAVGLMVNRPTGVRLSTVLPEIEGLKQRADTLYVGGPVNTNQMFLLIRSRNLPKDSVHVFEDIYASSSLSELQRLTEDPSPGEMFHAYAGYAGWGPGQLDQEVSRGDWHVLPADSGSVLDKKPSDIWPELIEKVSGLWV
jgi:putative transcriptional regulator